MTTTVDWNDGTGEKLYLTYGASEGTQTIAITSDPHTGYVTRSKDIVFSVSVGGLSISRTLTVSQSAKDITIVTFNDTAVIHNNTAVGYE